MKGQKNYRVEFQIEEMHIQTKILDDRQCAEVIVSTLRRVGVPSVAIVERVKQKVCDKEKT